MPATERPHGRLDRLLRAAHAERAGLLVIYLTLGDPLTAASADLALAAVEAGADVLEVGVPTPRTAPRGAAIAESFRRAGDFPPERAFGLLGELRAALPEVPLLPLVYPETLADLGRPHLVSASSAAGADGLVLTAPAGARELGELAADGLAAIPVVRPGEDGARRAALEAAADPMTYRTLSPATGGHLDPADLDAVAGALAREAAKPFLAGFGIAREAEIRTVARHAAGVVIGTELHRILLETAPTDRMTAARSAIRAWKAATRSDPAGARG